MSPSIEQLPTRAAVWERPAPHVVKKRKLNGDVHAWSSTVNHQALEADEEDDESATPSGVPPHPLGIKPSGNAYDAHVNLKDRCGSLSMLPDELLLELLEYLGCRDLLQLGGTCKALYAFTSSEDIWRALFVESPPKTFSWRGTWRATRLSLPVDHTNIISCAGLYSDALYLPFHRAHVPLLPYTDNIPVRNQIARLSDLTPDDFNTNWASKPFILTSPVKTWPVYKDWSLAHLTSNYSSTSFRAEAVDWPFSTYLDYMHNTTDESPLYLFDCRFAEKMNLATSSATTPTPQEPAYTPPHCFSPDLFTTLAHHRPNHRWLIIGPSRSGSTFHADPNGTSAWNAVLRGSKYWLMFPPPPPNTPASYPGIHISPTSSHITAPLSIAEYLVTFHAAARRHPGCIEAICAEGEVLHVPGGWFHLVLNLEDGVALTQNFVPRAGLVGVLEFMRDKREQVSGFRRGGDGVVDGDGHDGIEMDGVVEGREYEVFVERLRKEYPELLAESLRELERRDAKRARKTKWEELTGKGKEAVVENGVVESGERGFSFGFGFGDGDDDGVGDGDDDDDVNGEV